MKTTKLAASAIAAAILAGCTLQPKVSYYPLPRRDGSPPEDYEGLTKFTLAKSVLYIDKPDPVKPPTITSTPTEAAKADTTSSVRFMVKPHDGWFRKTHLTLTKVPNTDLISKAGVTVETTKVIESVGSIVVGTMTFVVAGATSPPSPATLPLVVDTAPLLAGRGDDKMEFDVNGKVQKKNEAEVRFKVHFGAVSDDAIPLSKYVEYLKTNGNQSTIFYSACRTAKVTFSSPVAGLTMTEFIVPVADPNFVQTLRLPTKGSANMHTICGADTASEVNASVTALDNIGKAVTQLNAIKDAWKTAKE